MKGTFVFMGRASENYGSTLMAAAGDSARAKNVAASAEQRVKVLEANLSKTLMICETLWELLRDEHGWSEENLHKKLYEVDMRDGVLDGKNQRKAVECPDCGHTVSSRHPACIYCGRVIDTSVFNLE
jgi:ribosomal protein S27AE